MVSFFRISTVYKYIFICFFFLIIRIPAITYGIPQILPELSWFLIAERMDEGFSLYSEIWDDIGPLSAYFYWLIYQIFGANSLALQVLTSLLVLVQAFMLNHFLRMREIYQDRTLIPVLLFLTLMHFFIDYFTLGPVLLANTFLIITMRYIFLHINERKKYNAVFEIGAYIGIATLFYLPSFVMLLVPLVSFILYTGTSFKDYILLLFAFLFTVGIAFLGFYLINSEYDFYLNFFQSLFYLKPQLHIAFIDLLKMVLIPLIFCIFGLFNTQLYRRYSNYQHRSQLVMILWLVVSLLSIILSSEISAYSFMLAIPAMVFILTHYLLMLKNTLFKEVIYMLILINSLYFLYSTLYKTPLRINLPIASWTKFEISVSPEKLLVKPHPQRKFIQNKRVLVLGDALGYYKGAHVASPYLNWRLAQRHMNKIDQYFNIKTQVYTNIFANQMKDIPEMLIDASGEAEFIFKQIPSIAQAYEAIPNTQPVIYRLKDELEEN